jgi:vacuolar-type H+-ATPase subunit I/STV1
MSNHTEENNLDPLAQLFIKPLISDVAVNEEEKEEVSAIEALLGPDVKKVEPGTKKEISRIDIPATTVSEVSVVPEEVVDQTEEVEDEQALEEFTENLEEKTEREEREETLEKGYWEKVFSIDLAKGSTGLGEMLFSLPETLYDLAALPQNLLVSAGILPEAFEVSSDEFKENFKLKNNALDYYQRETDKLEEQQTIWNNANYDVQGIYENFKKGNWTNGFQQLGSGIAESAPVSISMMLGGAATSIPRLAGVSTPFFMGPELERLREENPESYQAYLTIQTMGS